MIVLSFRRIHSEDYQGCDGTGKTEFGSSFFQTGKTQVAYQNNENMFLHSEFTFSRENVKVFIMKGYIRVATGCCKNILVFVVNFVLGDIPVME